MNEQEITIVTREQKKEIINILIGSSLYLDMSQTDRQKLIHYLVASYFKSSARWEQSSPSQGKSNRTGDVNRDALVLPSGLSIYIKCRDNGSYFIGWPLLHTCGSEILASLDVGSFSIIASDVFINNALLYRFQINAISADYKKTCLDPSDRFPCRTNSWRRSSKYSIRSFSFIIWITMFGSGRRFLSSTRRTIQEPCMRSISSWYLP